MNDTGFEHLQVSLDDGVLVITVNRPEVRNALAMQTWDELRRAALAAGADPDVRAVIITGAGDKSFVAGADIRQLQRRDVVDGLNSLAHDALAAIEEMPKPTIAAVNGYALGGGCELAMACDIRITAETARFGQPEVNLGVIPAAGGTQRLVRLVGLGKGKELVFTGAFIDAHEAHRIGLVNQVVPAEQLLTAARAMAAVIAAKAPLAVRLAKTAMQMSNDVDLRSGLAFERVAQSVLFATADKAEGTAAFLEKRPPRFVGR